jgi:hypothetical protein
MKCIQYEFVMSSMGLIMSSLRCCILRAPRGGGGEEVILENQTLIATKT